MKFKRDGLFFGFVLAILSINPASALSFYFLNGPRGLSESIINGFVEFFEPMLRVILGGNFWSGLLLFEKLLIMVALVPIVYLTIGKMPLFSEQKSIRWIIAVVVPLIGVRYMNYDWVNSIILQYALVTIVLAAALPFLIFFFFLHNSAENHPALRKIGWILFIVVYLGLWSTSESNHGEIYLWTMLISLMFLFFDGTIHWYYIKQKMKAEGSTTRWEHVAKLRRDIDEIRDSAGAGHLPLDAAKRLVQRKEKQIEWIMKRT